MRLVPLPPRTKRPTADDWGNNLLETPDAARAFYSAHPDWNIGAALGPSRLCSLDVDDLEATRLVFEEFGWDLDALRDEYPTVQGRSEGFRVMFSVPEGVTLPYHALSWPKQDGSKGRTVIFEIRAALEQQRQDVLPPSIHPDTQRPYVWLTKPPKTGLPPPPEFLLQIWRNWDALKPQFQQVCPWAEKPAPPAPKRAPMPGARDSVIDAYAQATDVEHALYQYGYKRQGKRWLSPHSTTGLPGVVVIDGKAFIHHASDPLCTDESGQPVDAFDLFAEYEHGGDKSKAMRAASKALGMDDRRQIGGVSPARNAPIDIDPDTGEITPANDNLPVVAAPLDPSCVDWFSPFPDVNGKGKPLATIENVADACRRLGVTVRYNVIKKDLEIMIPGAEFTVDNRANASLAWLASACTRFGIPTGPLGDYVGYLADMNLFNPVAQWITSRPWDGQSRLQDLYDTIQAEDEELKCVLLRRWLLSAVAAVFQPQGVSAHGVLVLQGDQYLGKTKWFKTLVPADLGVIQDGLMLRPDDRDSVKQVVSYWLVELGELDATFRKSDIAQLKSFLTRDRDVMRRAYAKMESEYARRTVFFASVNPREFLHDTTGNRRFWTIEAKYIDHSHGVNMQQLWAEVYELFKAKETYYLQPEEMARLNASNEEFAVVDPVQDRLSTKLDWAASMERWGWRSATDILVDVGIERPTQSDATRAAAFIRTKNGNQGKRTMHGRVLLVPPKVVF